MNVDPSDAAAREAMQFDEVENIRVLRRVGPRQLREKPEDLRPLPEVAERQLARDEGMTEDLALEKKRGEPFAPAPKVVDPDGRVDQDQRLVLVP